MLEDDFYFLQLELSDDLNVASDSNCYYSLNWNNCRNFRLFKFVIIGLIVFIVFVSLVLTEQIHKSFRFSSKTIKQSIFFWLTAFLSLIYELIASSFSVLYFSTLFYIPNNLATILRGISEISFDFILIRILKFTKDFSLFICYGLIIISMLNFILQFFYGFFKDMYFSSKGTFAEVFIIISQFLSAATTAFCMICTIIIKSEIKDIISKKTFNFLRFSTFVLIFAYFLYSPIEILSNVSSQLYVILTKMNYQLISQTNLFGIFFFPIFRTVFLSISIYSLTSAQYKINDLDLHTPDSNKVAYEKLMSSLTSELI